MVRPVFETLGLYAFLRTLILRCGRFDSRFWGIGSVGEMNDAPDRLLPMRGLSASLRSQRQTSALASVSQPARALHAALRTGKALQGDRSDSLRRLFVKLRQSTVRTDRVRDDFVVAREVLVQEFAVRANP